MSDLCLGAVSYGEFDGRSPARRVAFQRGGEDQFDPCQFVCARHTDRRHDRASAARSAERILGRQRAGPGRPGRKA